MKRFDRASWAARACLCLWAGCVGTGADLAQVPVAPSSSPVAAATATPAPAPSLLTLNIPTVAIVRAAQRSVADADVGGPQVLVDDDLVLDDKIHLSKTSQLTMGDRL